MFAWFRRWRRRSQSDRTERNMVIRRIVSAVADESLKKQSVRQTHAAADDRVTTADGRPVTPLPAGKPPSDSKPVVTQLPAGRPQSDSRPVTPLPAGKPPSNGRPFAPLPPVESADAGDVPRDRVAQRAFEIWVRNGRPPGTHDADWAQAAAELRAEQLYRPADAPP